MKQSIFDPNFQNRDSPAKIVAALERISETFKVLLWEKANKHSLSPIQIQIVHFIAYHSQDKASVSHLALEFNVSKPTISDAVRVLHQKSLVKKLKSEVDGRAYTLSLTSKGRKVLANTQDLGEPIRMLALTLSKTDQAHFLEMLNKMIYGLHNMNILGVQRMCFTCTYFHETKRKKFCQLLDRELKPKDLRIDCPEFILRD
ncbi:MAG: winged helix-turn-helix transcriptional regulator [Saprospiraceae bacterium]|nr:winged helix-turn-helix transcriptional regulator [Saprospiraceae bacterium]